MRSGVSAGGKTFTRYSDSERAARAAAKRQGKNRLVGQGHPTTSDIHYSKDEWEFMQAVQGFQHRTGKRFPTWREIYHVFLELGYEKAPADEAGADEVPEIVAFG